MLDSTSDTVLISAFVIVAPLLVSLPVALVGSGRAVWVAVWVAAVLALALTVAGLRYATAIYYPLTYDGIGNLLFGILLSALGLQLGLGTCTVALICSARERRWAWVVALLVAAALPLLAALPIFDLNMLAVDLASPSTSPGMWGLAQFRVLALLLPPIGCAVLVAYGAWSAWMRRRPRVATPFATPFATP